MQTVITLRCSRLVPILDKINSFPRPLHRGGKEIGTKWTDASAIVKESQHGDPDTYLHLVRYKKMCDYGSLLRGRQIEAQLMRRARSRYSVRQECQLTHLVMPAVPKDIKQDQASRQTKCSQCCHSARCISRHEHSGTLPFNPVSIKYQVLRK